MSTRIRLRRISTRSEREAKPGPAQDRSRRELSASREQCSAEQDEDDGVTTEEPVIRGWVRIVSGGEQW